MKALIAMVLLISVSAMAQTKSESTTPPAINSVMEAVSGKRFVPDTAFAALTQEDQTLLANQPVANWSLLQETGQEMAYSNLVVGTRSYQVVITRPPKSDYPTATLLRYTTPKSKPEPLARGTLHPKVEEKAK